jgi:hypothetical protein
MYWAGEKKGAGEEDGAAGVADTLILESTESGPPSAVGLG